ncbi:hypothetical protein [Winogradskyella sp. R77965]|uniref:hypothetical protein n=1 Tax=Winogradskyella sp. R77965 TaxID=3093872 RepID=UPI0037DC4A40
MESEPLIREVNLMIQVFTHNHVIEALATGVGVYEYNLDDNLRRDEVMFSNI